MDTIQMRLKPRFATEVDSQAGRKNAGGGPEYKGHGKGIPARVRIPPLAVNSGTKFVGAVAKCPEG